MRRVIATRFPAVAVRGSQGLPEATFSDLRMACVAAMLYERRELRHKVQQARGLSFVCAAAPFKQRIRCDDSLRSKRKAAKSFAGLRGVPSRTSLLLKGVPSRLWHAARAAAS